MKAIQFQAKGKVAICDLPDPVAGPGEVLIKVRASGLCHTDIDVLHARYGAGAFPVVPGHEYAGEVLSLGDGVSGFHVGQRVVVDPNLSCGTCRSCQRGRFNLCTTLGAYGVSTNGGFAELSVVNAFNLHDAGDLPFDQAALAEPMACILNGVSALAPTAQDEALVIGAGPIGMLLAIALRTRGVTDITLADIDPQRLQLAESFGFKGVNSRQGDLSSYRHSMDICADATGRAEVAGSMVDLVADGGRALFFGVCAPTARIEISPFEVFRRQLQLLGTHSLNRNIPDALAAIRAEGSDIARLVSHHVSLDEVGHFMQTHAPAGSLKIQASFD